MTSKHNFCYGIIPAVLVITSSLIWQLVAFAQQGPPYNILLLTMDQESAPFMHLYGYSSPDTPNLEKLAAEGMVFNRAYSAGPWTTPSWGSIHTGLYPTVHGMTLEPYHGAAGPDITNAFLAGRRPPIPANVDLSPYKKTLAEMLKSSGMVTAADNANPWSIINLAGRGWDSFKFVLPPPYGWPNGAPEFINPPDPQHPDGNDRFYLTAPKTTAWAQQWLHDHRQQRFFLWVHYMEPHEPFNPPPEYDRFKTQDDYPDLTGDNGPDVRTLQSRAKIGDTHAIRRLGQLYAGKILYVDHYAGELLNTVHDLGLDNKTIIIVTSDHGELMYTHPLDYNTENHRSLYDTNVHVPLIFRGPQVSAGKRTDALAGHYDIMPTILDLEDLTSATHLDGASLKAVLAGTAARAHQYVYSEQSDLLTQYSVRGDRFELIETMLTGKTQCFDTLIDPAEQNDICFLIPSQAAELKQALDEHIQEVIQEAKSFPDWKDNLALAVLEQRDTPGLVSLAPRNSFVNPGPEPSFQLTGSGWSILTGVETCPGAGGVRNLNIARHGSESTIKGLAYWAQPGPADASITWSNYLPMLGEYEIAVCSGGSGPLRMRLAKYANYTVTFRGGTLSFVVDQNAEPGQWHVLGRFVDPISVRMTNQADGPVVAGSTAFRRVTGD
jgi:arylsulfatase A-like enzyme